MKGAHKEYQKLSPILVSIIGKGLNFKQGQKTGKNLKKIIQNPPNTKEISVAYKSKYKQKREKQVILLMITDGNKWHYLAVSNLSAMFAKKSSNHNGDLYCLGCFNSDTTVNRLKDHEDICKKHRNPPSCQKNNRVCSWKKIIKSTICNLS